MRISEERGITGLTAAPVGDDETRIPHRPRLHESFQLLGSYGHVREVPHAVITAAPVQGRGCCACLVGIEHGPCGDCAYCPRSSPCRALMIFIQHATWRCVASSGAAGAAGHSVTESRRGRTTRNKHSFANVPFVNIGAQIILHALRWVIFDNSAAHPAVGSFFHQLHDGTIFSADKNEKAFHRQPTCMHPKWL